MEANANTASAGPNGSQGDQRYRRYWEEMPCYLSVHDPDAVWAFLRDHDERLGARAKREVRNKLTTGLKNPKRKTKN